MAALFTTVGLDLGPVPWACSCGDARDMPTIGNWSPDDTTWYHAHQHHGAHATAPDDAQTIGTMPEIPGQLDMFGGAA